MRIELEMPESVKEKVDELIVAYAKHNNGRTPDFIRMNMNMYNKLCRECGADAVTPDDIKGVKRTYNGMTIGIFRVPDGVIDAGEWA